MQQDSNRTKYILLALGFITLALYWQVSSFEFINYDDPDYVVNNPVVRAGVTKAGVFWALSSSYACNWHPVTWISHMADVNLGGMHAGRHHFTNLLFHIANTLLLFGILRRMTGAVWRSACVAALFAWHPLHVESVAWVSERKDVLSAFFWLLTIWAYSFYTVKKTPGRYLLILLAFGLGLMSKPMVVTLPCVLLLLDVWPLKRIALPRPLSNGKEPEDSAQQKLSPFKLILEKVPLFIMAGIGSSLNLWAQKNGATVISLQTLALPDRIINVFVSYIRYLGKTFWPVDLTILYPFDHTWTVWHGVGAGLVLIVITLFAIGLARRRPYLAIGWFWFVGSMVPVIGFVQVGLQSMADRYTYIPLIGIFIMLVWGLTELLVRNGALKSLLPYAAVIVLGGCIVTTWMQLQHWQNTVTLFGRTVAVTSNNIRASYNLAQGLDSRGREEEAIVQYEKTLELKPNRLEMQFNSQIDAHYNLGTLFARRERLVEAREQLQAALKMKPDHQGARNNLGSVMVIQGDLNEAIEEFRTVLKTDPQNSVALQNLARALAEQGNYQEAITFYTTLLREHPEDAVAHYDFGLALTGAKEFERAIEEFGEGLRLEPRLITAQVGLGDVLVEQGKPAEAEVHYAAALNLQSDLAWKLNELALSMASHGRNRAALKQLYSAKRLSPQFAPTYLNIGRMLLRDKRTEAAIAELRKAIELDATETGAMNELAWVLATHPDPAIQNATEALKIAERACQLTEQKDPRLLSALDAAYAASGRFAEAIKTAEKAVELAGTEGQKELAAQATERLALYRAGKAYRQ